MTLVRIAPQPGTVGATGPTGSSGTLIAYKPAITSRATTVTPTADPHLTLTLPSTGTYQFEVDFVAQCPASSVNIMLYPGYSGSVTSGFVGSGALATSGSWQDGTNFSSGGANTIALTAGVYTPCMMTGFVIVGTVGALSLNWSQGTSNASAVRISAGACLKAFKVA